jgi:hypothetical protein
MQKVARVLELVEAEVPDCCARKAAWLHGAAAE